MGNRHIGLFPQISGWKFQNWLVVSTHLKDISQIGSFPLVGVKIKNGWKHQPEKYLKPPGRHWRLSLLPNPSTPRVTSNTTHQHPEEAAKSGRKAIVEPGKKTALL